jgi:hypothetical protein
MLATSAYFWMRYLRNDLALRHVVSMPASIGIMV